MLAGLARLVIYILSVLRARPASIIYFMINRRAYRCGSQYRLQILPLRFNLGIVAPAPHPQIVSSIFSALPMGKAFSHCCQCAGGMVRPPVHPLALWRGSCALALAQPLRLCPSQRADGRLGRSSVVAPPPLSLGRGGRAGLRSAVLSPTPSAIIHPPHPFLWLGELLRVSHSGCSIRLSGAVARSLAPLPLLVRAVFRCRSSPSTRSALRLENGVSILTADFVGVCALPLVAPLRV